MTDSPLVRLSKLSNRLLKRRSEKAPIETLTAFVRDAEHDVLTVVTALQAHVDLLREEQERNNKPVVRFTIVNRAIARVISDISVLTVISDLVLKPRSTDKQALDTLMQEVATDTESAFKERSVSLSWNIPVGTTLLGEANALKVMITALLLFVLHHSLQSDNVTVLSVTSDNRLCLSFDTGSQINEGTFKPWQLGRLELSPVNGEGIKLSAVDAIARLHDGHLDVRNLSGERFGYALIFDLS
jgi:light-regulated signal transduction histidine kinase (bacteriophytochrome)